MGNKVTGVKIRRRRLLDDSDGRAFQRLPDLKGRDITLSIFHSTTHIRVNRHPEVSNQQLTLRRIFQRPFREFEVGLLWQAFGAASQVNFVGKNTHIIPFSSIFVYSIVYEQYD